MCRTSTRYRLRNPTSATPLTLELAPKPIYHLQLILYTAMDGCFQTPTSSWRNIDGGKKLKEQAEAEVVPSSSLVEVYVEAGVDLI